MGLGQRSTFPQLNPERLLPPQLKPHKHTPLSALPKSVLDFAAKVIEGKRTKLDTFHPSRLATQEGLMQYAVAYARRELLTEIATGLREVAAGQTEEAVLGRIITPDSVGPEAPAGASGRPVNRRSTGAEGAKSPRRKRASDR